MLSAGMEHQPVTTASENSDVERKLAPPESLSGMRLIHAACVAEGEQLVGNPSDSFAFLSKSDGCLVVISEDSRKVRYFSPERVMTEAAMAIAQELGAGFLVHGKQVVCNIRGISQAGDSYGEAALRAIVAYRRDETEQNGAIKEHS